MNHSFIIIAIILFILAYLIGVRKQTWLLSGFNEKHVRDKKKLSSIVGSFNLIMGMVMVGGAFIKHPDAQALIPILVIGHMVLIAYVNMRMIE
jgi:Domain of unknown function (DUF3784)